MQKIKDVHAVNDNHGNHYLHQMDVVNYLKDMMIYHKDDKNVFPVLKYIAEQFETLEVKK